MSNNKQQGGKPKATNGDDVLVGTSKNDNLSGKKGDDQISGLAGNDKLKGDQGNDLLDGGTGNDVLYGGKGDDRLLGGAGNDVLYGDDGKSKGWGWDKFCWWKPQSDYDDYLDGGAGSDKVYGGKGNDVAVYSMAGNLGAGFKNIGTKDDYDGGTGNDTLVLQLTYGEAALGSVKQDVAAFQKFLDSRANSRGEEFEFKSFNLDVSNFEALQIQLVNTGPTARADAGATNEDTLLVVAGPGVLANDSDADHLDVLSVITGGTTSAKGASVVLTAGGGYSYNPTGALALQQLGQGQTTTDTFSYTIADLGGATSTAIVSITVSGVNDAPIATADSFTTDEDTPLNGSVLGNDTDVDSPALTATLVGSTTNGTLSFNGDGSFTYTPNANFFGTDSFSYKASDGALVSNLTSVSLTVRPVNDAPVANPDDFTLDEDTTLSSNVLANDMDADGPAALTATLVSSATNGTLAFNTNGSFTYTPNADFNGADSFTYKANDGASDSEAVTVSLNVNPVNDAPVVDDEEIVIGGGGEGGDEPASQGNPFLISSALLLAGITDPEGDPLFISEVSAFSELGAEVSLVDGNVVYDPTEGLKRLAEGEEVTDTFTYTVSDGQASFARFASFSATSGGTIVTASIKVRGVNDAPVAGADSFTLNEDSTFTSNVLANDVDPDSPALTASLVSGAAHGSVTLSSNGSFTYTPNANFFGSDSFTYQASDGSLDSAATTVSLTVNDVAEPQPASKVLPSVGPEAQLEYYIRFDAGSGTPEWMQLDGFSWGAKTPVALGGAGGAGTGKSSAEPVSLSLGSSQTATKLAQYLATGKHLEVEIEAYAPGGDKGDQLVDQYYFENVLLSNLTTHAASGSAPQEEVAFNYTKVNHSHLTQNNDGSAGSITHDGWDFALSQDANGFGPAAQGDAIKAKLDGTTGELEYYVTFQGAGGWLELSSFSMGMSVPVTIIGGGGAGSGKVSMDPAMLGLGSSKELLLLTDALTEGKHLTFLEVEAYASGGDKGRQLVDQYYFENVFVTSFEGDGANANTVGLDFIKFAHGHIEQSATGDALPAIEVGWDISKNESYSVGTDADFDKSLPLPSVGPEAQLEYYIRFDAGSGTPEWMQLDGFSWGAKTPVALGGAGGAGTGKSSAEPVSLSLGSSQTATKLAQYLATGKHLEVEIEAYAPGGDKGDQLVDQYYFENVLLSNLTTHAASGSAPQEEVAFNYTKVNHSHLTQNNDGSAGSITHDGWDFALSQDANGFGPAAQGDAIKAKLDGTTGELEYYVTFQGAGGWLELSSFSMGMSVPVTIIGGGGAGSGKVSMDPAMLGLGSSKELLLLTDALTEGKHLTFLEVEAYASGGDKGRQLVDQYYFENVFVTSFEGDGANANTVGLDFIKFAHGHIEQSATGDALPAIEVGWDISKNESYSVGTDADFDKSLPLPSVGPEAQLEYYIRFDAGSGTPEWMELDGFSWGAKTPVALGGAGGAGTGKSSAEPVSLSLGSSQTATKLAQYLATGKHLEVEIEAYAPGGDKGAQLVDQYYFENVLLSNLTTHATSGSAPQEEVAFNYTKVNHSHLTQNNDGSAGSITHDGWDFALSQDANGFGPAAQGDAIKAKLDGTTGELEYYVTFQGAGGWLELSSFSMGMSVPVTIIGGGGAGSGKVSMDPAMLGLGSSKELLLLTDALTEGKHLTFLEVEAYASGGDKGRQLVDQYYFENVFVTSFEGDGANANTVGLDFIKFAHGHIEQSATGAALPAIEVGWDISLNQSYTVGTDSDLF